MMRDAGTVTVIEARDNGDVEGHPPNTTQAPTGAAVHQPPRRDRATALVEDICCDKIRGCSCGDVRSIGVITHAARNP